MERLMLIEVPALVRKDGESYLGDFPSMEDFYEDVIMINPQLIGIISDLEIEGKSKTIIGINGNNLLLNVSKNMLLETISRKRKDVALDIIFGMRN